MTNEELDPIVSGYQEDDKQLSEAEINKRTQVFQKRVKKAIATLEGIKKFDAKRRTAAAVWLGGAGEPTAIPALVKAFESDPDKQVRAAAAEALGRLKALGALFEDPDEDVQKMGFEIVQDIVLHGKMGKRLNPRPQTVTRLSVGVLLLGVLLLGVGLVLPANEPPKILSLADELTLTAAVVTPTEIADPLAALERFRVQYVGLDNDARALQAQMLLITRDQPQDCAVEWNNMPSFVASTALTQNYPQYDTLAPAIVDYNAAQEKIAPIIEVFLRSCRAQIPISRQDALTYGAQIVEVQRTLVNVGSVLSRLGLSLPPTATPFVVSTNTPTPTATVTPTATPDAAAIRVHVLALRDIANRMSGLRGTHTLVLTFWQEVVNDGRTAGCLQLPPPDVDGDYVLPSDIAAIAPAELQQAVDNINLALSVTRRTWAAFAAACSANTLAASASAQLGAAQAAQQAYKDALTALETVERSLR